MKTLSRIHLFHATRGTRAAAGLGDDCAVNELGQYYGLQDTIFKEYLRTLGVRT